MIIKKFSPRSPKGPRRDNCLFFNVPSCFAGFWSAVISIVVFEPKLIKEAAEFCEVLVEVFVEISLRALLVACCLVAVVADPVIKMNE